MLKRTGIILSIMVTMALVSAISLSFGVRPATADDAGQVNLSPVELPEKGNLKLSSKLTRLISANEHAEAEEFARPRGIELVDGSIRVIIECLAGEVKAVAEAAGALGVVQLTTRRLVQAVVPITSLTALADTPGIRFVRLPWRPVLEEEVVSQGVDLIEADEWHTAGFDGTGVKVGILDTGFAGYSALLGSELPNDNDVEENWGPGGEGNSDHGTACAEIVYDIAEGAQFYLAKYGTDAEFEDAVDWFIEEEVDVISCSGSYPAKGPGDGTGPICEVVDAARAAGIVWSQAVGNYAQRHWEGPFVDTDTDGRHDFRQNPRDESNTVAVELGDKILVFLNWDDTWGESGNDYDLYLYNKFGGQPVARGDDVQDGDDDPYEWLEWTATYTGNYRIYIDAWGEPDVVNLSLYSVKINLEYQVASSSFVVPADSPNAMAVGAVHWDTPTEIEDYSSRGPTTDDRKKPDLVAPTCVETATDNSFCGTSAATPHAAGAAVLVKECYSSYAPADVQSFLENSAVELGAAGKDNVFGSGRLELPTDKVEVVLVDGYTIIALAVQPPVAYTASTLAAHINSQDGSITEVFRWNPQAGDWDFWLVEEEYGDDFDIILGEGYLLKNEGDASTWTYWGAELPDGPGQVPLVAGYNLIALPVIPDASYTASTMAAEINNQGGSVTQVFWWNPLAGAWDFWLVEEEYGDDFDIEIGEGYLLNCTAASTWTIQ